MTSTDCNKHFRFQIIGSITNDIRSLTLGKLNLEPKGIKLFTLKMMNGIFVTVGAMNKSENRPMIRIFAVFFSLILAATSVNAQSTLTLDDFELDKSPAKAPVGVEKSATSSELENCLADSKKCKSSKFKSTTSFSIDDVVNLGIIDREEVKIQPASTDASSPVANIEPLPSIDMEILFDYDSDTVRADQYEKLRELSSVLINARFDGFRFAFLGHSDAKGNADYNRNLSFRRAEAVSKFLSASFGLDQGRMISSGMGSSRLKTPADPFGAANRRVQLVLIPVK